MNTKDVEVPAPSFAELNQFAAARTNHDERYLVRSEYSGCKLRQMTYDELSEECTYLWGEQWRAAFLAAADIHPRTLERWWSGGLVLASGVTAMVLAFRRLKDAGMSYPGSPGGVD